MYGMYYIVSSDAYFNFLNIIYLDCGNPYYLLVRLLTSDMKIHNPCICIHKGFVCNEFGWSCIQHHPQCTICNFSYAHCIYRGCVFLYQRLANVLVCNLGINRTIKNVFILFLSSEMPSNL